MKFPYGRYSRNLLVRHTSSRHSVILLGALLSVISLRAQVMEVRNAAGVRMGVDMEDRDPALIVSVPDGPVNERSFKILLPEHVTVRAHGETEAKHLYVFQPGVQNNSPKWTKAEDSLEYARNFGDIHFVARATLMDDGILFRYEFVNHSEVDYDMATAITDPRFRVVFYDPRLERTYVHRKDGFELLGADTPERLTMPLKDWFPVRYMASYTAPIPAERVQHRDDGITYRYASHAVDVPMIATLSADRTWVAASFARDPGNVWSNPELTCQHVDPEVALRHGEQAVYEVKILLFKGSLDDALHKVSEQRQMLK